MMSGRRRDATALAATAPKAPQTPLQAPQPPLRPSKPVDLWPSVVEAEKTGATLQVKVKSVNKGGLVAALGDVKGFIPFNQLTSVSGRGETAGSDLSFLIGQDLRVKVVSIDTTAGRKEFVGSERKAAQSEAMRNVKLGQTLRAVVTGIEDWGAFVELVDISGVSGLVHKSELSWDSVVSVEAMVQKGKAIQVKVIDVDAAKCRLGLSVKQTQPDPIKMTLDKVQWKFVTAEAVPEDIQALIARLKKQPEVEDVTLGRQAVEAKIASQELVVYLTKDGSLSALSSRDGQTEENGFDMVARVGNVLQELHVSAKVSRDEAKGLIARVARS